ncbi:uncharacterized protein EI97DRAFT_474652 [Westerdykella ornata]|uniref:Uncharacterized protein n=1 Tax=Westerdykella ornata TaxID=318751 RepID=A0A6A6JJU7_WESOR|nr:uncharacterized protein EI97DRAFT_474652 [Westerdykella ornata]KAF2275966.1 hypothetical protein EI97DRAFT_474652 [Westerdykella ornata]
MPTHSEVTRFISSLLPPKPNDIPLLYHIPQSRTYNFDTAPCDQVVLSVTPTAGVYALLGPDPPNSRTTNSPDDARRPGSEEPRPPNTIAFLHRPDHLDRSRIRDNVLVLASHTSFTEHLTLGWNPYLAARLGVDTSPSSNTFIPVPSPTPTDPDRRIGALARINTILGPLLDAIEFEFGAIEAAQEGLSEEIHILALMNEFGADDVHRVLDLAVEQGWVRSERRLGRHVVCLTGRARGEGLEEAGRRGCTVVCVGEGVGEQWGIGFMAARVREEFGGRGNGVRVREVYEDELGG